MLGPAADEVAEMMRDQIRLYRYERQLTCMRKAAKVAEEAGFNPEPVSPKILFPLLEGASFEENEELHTMWAALLANASLPNREEAVRPGHIALLKQMAPDEAAVLNWLCGDENKKKNPRSLYFPRGDWFVWDIPSAYQGASSGQFEACLASLQAAFLISKYNVRIDDKVVPKLQLTPVKIWILARE